MIRTFPAWPTIIVASAIGVSLVTYANMHTPIRPLIALWFLCVCPGMSLVRLLGFEDISVQLTLAVALSLALDALVASVMLYAGVWSPAGSLAILIAISVGGIALGRVSAGRRRDAAPPAVSSH